MRITCELHYAHVDISNLSQSALCIQRLGNLTVYAFGRDLKVNLLLQAQERYKVWSCPGMARHFVSKQEKKYDMNSNPLDAVPKPDHKGIYNNKNKKNTNSPQRTEKCNYWVFRLSIRQPVREIKDVYDEWMFRNMHSKASEADLQGKNIAWNNNKAKYHDKIADTISRWEI